MICPKCEKEAGAKLYKSRVWPKAKPFWRWACECGWYSEQWFAKCPLLDAHDSIRLASRLPSIKEGEVETLLRIESCVRSLRDCGPEYIGAEECRLLDRLDALRSAHDHEN